MKRPFQWKSWGSDRIFSGSGIVFAIDQLEAIVESHWAAATHSERWSHVPVVEVDVDEVAL